MLIISRSRSIFSKTVSKAPLPTMAIPIAIELNLFFVNMYEVIPQPIIFPTIATIKSVVYRVGFMLIGIAIKPMYVKNRGSASDSIKILS